MNLAADVLDLETYEVRRPELHGRALRVKATRRVEVGPHVTALFENRATALDHLHEVLRIGQVRRPEAIAAERAFSESLIPGAGELVLTLFVEEGARVFGLESSLSLAFDGRAVGPDPSSDWRAENEQQGVQFVRFRIDRIAFRAAADVRLRFDHPDYRHETRLPIETIDALRADQEETSS